MLAAALHCYNTISAIQVARVTASQGVYKSELATAARIHIVRRKLGSGKRNKNLPPAHSKLARRPAALAKTVKGVLDCNHTASRNLMSCIDFP